MGQTLNPDAAIPKTDARTAPASEEEEGSPTAFRNMARAAQELLECYGVNGIILARRQELQYLRDAADG
jgi:hypothetical protein